MQDNLFDLIKSLSPSEKRYITTNAKKGAKYLKLLQAIYEMEVYDEGVLKKDFGKRLPVEKNNLYNVILKNIRNFQSDKSDYIEIKNLILDANFLLDRGLYEQAQKRLKKAKSLAQKCYKNADLWEIIILEKKILFQIKPPNIEVEISNLTEEHTKIIHLLEEEKDTSNQYYKLGIQFLKNIRISTEKEKTAFLQKFSETEWKNLDSEWAKYYAIMYKKIRSMMLDDNERVFFYCQSVLDWWKDKKWLEKLERSRFIQDKINYIIACLSSQKLDLIPPILNRLENLKTETVDETKEFIEAFSIAKHLYYIKLGNFEKAINEFKIIEQQFLGSMREKQRIVLTVNHSIALFCVQNYHESIKYLDAISLPKKAEKRRDIQSFARILKCIAMYELKDEDGFDSSYRAARRYLKIIEGEKGDIEGDFLSLIRQLNNAVFREKVIIYKKIHHFLIDKKESPNLLHWRGLSEYLLWIESKLNGISIIEVIKSKTQP